MNIPSELSSHLKEYLGMSSNGIPLVREIQILFTQKYTKTTRGRHHTTGCYSQVAKKQLSGWDILCEGPHPQAFSRGCPGGSI